MCRKDQAVRLAEFAKMPEEQRRVRLADLAASVNRRLAADDAAEPDETKEETPPPAPDLPVNAPERARHPAGERLLAATDALVWNALTAAGGEANRAQRASRPGGEGHVTTIRRATDTPPRAA